MDKSQVILTIDIDWAPDFMIDYVAELLIDADVKCTWFITHEGAALDRLREHAELFELGIHPNFLPNSSHGKTPKEVIDFCCSLVPEAVSMRTHALVYSTLLFMEILPQMPLLQNDVSIYQRMSSGLQPSHLYVPDASIRRVPFLWEDDLEMNAPESVWILDEILSLGDGLKVLNFHPIHIYMNAFNMKNYEELKKLGNIAELGEVDVQGYGNRDHVGTRSLFIEAVEHLRQSVSLNIRDIN